MVQEPSFFTLAGQDVRRPRSRSVAVMESLSPAASKRKLESMGMVVLRSTTPCVAVSSRNKSALLTVISMLDDAASTPVLAMRPTPGSAVSVGIYAKPSRCLAGGAITSLTYIKTIYLFTAVTVGAEEKWNSGAKSSLKQVSCGYGQGEPGP